MDMDYIKESVVAFKDREIRINTIDNIDYLLSMVKSDDDVPFWAVLWPAAIGLAEYFWDTVDFDGETLLELGAGLGLSGIAAALKNARVVQSDFIPEALQLAEENGRKNRIHDIDYILADWRRFEITDRFKWIIGSDILYEPNLHPYLKNIFAQNLAEGGTIVLADPGREDAGKFIKELAAEGYRVRTVEKTVPEGPRDVKVTLYFLNK